MKRVMALVLALGGLSLVAVDADAARLGGARNLGMQRNIQQAPPKAPAQQTPAPQQAQTGGTAAPAATASGNKWMGPLAGLALGAGLMALFMNNGIAGALAGVLLLAALVGMTMVVVRALRGHPARSPMQYAGSDSQAATLSPGTGPAPHSLAASTTATGRWPADFDVAEFVRHARQNFVRLQAAHDARDSASLADVLTPDLLADVQALWGAETDAPTTTDVVTLQAEVLDVVTEGLLHIVSVRYSGLIRETADGAPQAFAEIWHLEKPLRGSGGWLVSGIQQA